MKFHAPKCHVCKKQVGVPYVVRPGRTITEVLCFSCPDDSYNSRMYPASPRIAPAVRKPLPLPRKQILGDEEPNSLAGTIMPMFADEWSDFND